jgi:hypothetical protein
MSSFLILKWEKHEVKATREKIGFAYKRSSNCQVITWGSAVSGLP